LRAKLALSKGDVDGATKALQAVISAPGMNARDQYRAEYQRINLTLEARGKTDEAKAAYEKLVDTISKGEKAQGEVSGQQANVARVYHAVFDMSHEKSKDMESLDRAISAYFQLHEALPQGPQKKTIAKAWKELSDKKKALLATGTPTKPPEPPPPPPPAMAP